MPRQWGMKFIAPLLTIALAGCTATTAGEPSLGRRAAEAIDPRLPVTNAPATDPADPSLTARVAELLAQGRAAEAAFNAAEPRVTQLVAASGPAQSESWITAQLAFSELARLRGPAVVAAADLDEMRATQAQSGKPALASELQLVESAAEELRAINARMAAVTDRLDAVLAR